MAFKSKVVRKEWGAEVTLPFYKGKRERKDCETYTSISSLWFK